MFFHGVENRLLESEQYITKSLLLMDNLFNVNRQEPLCISPILNEIGYNALRLFGDIVLARSRPQLAVVAYEASISNLKFRGIAVPTVELSRIAKLCGESLGLPLKAIKYFQPMLDHFIEARSANEVVHVAFNISELFLQEGNVQRAEDFLEAAASQLISWLNDSTSSNQRHVEYFHANTIKTCFTKLKLKIAQNMLQFGKIANAIMIIEDLINEKMVMPVYTVDLLLTLAKAYYQANWVCESLEALLQLKVFTDEAFSHRIVNSWSTKVNGRAHRIVQTLCEFTQKTENLILNEEQRYDAYFLHTCILMELSYAHEAISLHKKLLLPDPDSPNFGNLSAEYFYNHGKLCDTFSRTHQEFKDESIPIPSSSALQGSVNKFMRQYTRRLSVDTQISPRRLSSQYTCASSFPCPSNSSPLTEREVLEQALSSYFKASEIFTDVGEQSRAFECKGK
jgi:tetratricopeptide (TPR) repeat protein